MRLPKIFDKYLNKKTGIVDFPYVATLYLTILLDNKPQKIQLTLLAVDQLYGKKLSSKDLGSMVADVINMVADKGLLIAQKTYSMNDGKGRILIVSSDDNALKKFLIDAVDINKDIIMTNISEKLKRELSEIFGEYQKAIA